MKTRMIAAVLAVIALLALAACGGGEGPPVTSESQLDYSNTAAPRHSYTPYQTYSHIYTVGRGDDPALVYIGGDLEPRENLRHVTTLNGIRYFMGASRDGVGVDRLENYETDLTTRDGDDRLGLYGDGFYPFRVPPRVVVDTEFWAEENFGILVAFIGSMMILNDGLPPEFQMAVTDTRTTPGAYSGEIFVSLESPDRISSVCGARAVACAVSTTNRIWGYTDSAVLYLPNDFDTSAYTFPRKVIIHELLHALGIQGHVDSIEFPDSIMGAAGEYIPNPGFVISKIDREVLQIMYMSQRTDLYNDWGEWSDTSFHVMGASEDGALRFGVALFNGLPQPWTRGALPDDTALADNDGLSGTATWNGALLAFSGPSPIAGDAELEVDLGTLADDDSEQDLRFRDIYFVNRFESDGEDRWFPTRNIDYKLTVSDNAFQNVTDEGYEEGWVTGAFLGSNHEHMGGTLKRTDMVGAFGGSR